MKRPLVAGALLTGLALSGCAESKSDSPNTTPTTPAAAATSAAASSPSALAVTLEALKKAKLTVPQWPHGTGFGCTELGPVVDMTKQDPAKAHLELGTEIVMANLDADADLEAAVVIKCVDGKDPSTTMQIVAIEGGATGFTTLGQIAVFGVDTSSVKLTKRDAGGVTVTEQPKSGSATTKSYAWDGKAFVEVKA